MDLIMVTYLFFNEVTLELPSLEDKLWSHKKLFNDTRLFIL